MAGRVFPSTGLLSFFEYQDWYHGEHGPPAILYTPPGAELRLLDAPDDLSEDRGRPHQPATFTLRESLDLPAWGEPWEERLGFPPYERTPAHSDLTDRYWEFLKAQREVTHALFGYARPRHVVCDPIPGPEWEQLLTFSSDDTLKWGWGDGHELFWYIRSEDLKAGRFDRTETING